MSYFSKPCALRTDFSPLTGNLSFCHKFLPPSSVTMLPVSQASDSLRRPVSISARSPFANNFQDFPDAARKRAVPAEGAVSRACDFQLTETWKQGAKTELCSRKSSSTMYRAVHDGPVSFKGANNPNQNRMSG